MKKTAPPHVINVFRDKLVMCTPTNSEPIVFKFTKSMVSDLEVVSHEELNTGLKTFVVQYKLKPANLVIILHSSVYFEKDYPGPGLPASQAMEDFIDTIPFSATSSKIFRSGNGYKQIVINRDLYESLKKLLEGLGFSISAVVPGFVIGPEPLPDITADACRLIFKKMDQITTESFTGFNDPSATLQQKEQMFLKRYQLPVIILSLLFLVVAVIVIPITLKKPPKPVKKNPVPISRPTPTAVPTEIPALSTPSAEILSKFTVQILNGSGKSGQAASLSAKLREVGFTEIETGNNPQVTQKTLLILSPQIASAAGEFVTDLVSQIYPGLSTNTNSQADFDLTVIIGKNTP